MIRLRSQPDPREGYALILVMVAMVTLTVLGVTAISSSQLDMKVTQNMRINKQLQYGAIAGQDYAKTLLDGATTDTVAGLFDQAEAAADLCLPAWIADGGTHGVDPETLSVNGTLLASYSVDVCVGVCSNVQPPGSQLNGNTVVDGGDGTGSSFSLFSVDVVSTGVIGTSTSSAQVGGLLMALNERGCG